MILNRNFHFTIVEWNAFHSVVPFHGQPCIFVLYVLYNSTVSFLLHFIRHNHDRNAFVTYLTAIVCNCHIVTDGIELKYTICAKQNGGCNNIFQVFNDNIELNERY